MIGYTSNTYRISFYSNPELDICQWREGREGRLRKRPLWKVTKYNAQQDRLNELLTLLQKETHSSLLRTHTYCYKGNLVAGLYDRLIPYSRLFLCMGRKSSIGPPELNFLKILWCNIGNINFDLRTCIQSMEHFGIESCMRCYDVHEDILYSWQFLWGTYFHVFQESRPICENENCDIFVACMYSEQIAFESSITLNYQAIIETCQRVCL